MPFLQARHPNHLTSEHSILVENLLEMAFSGRQEVVDATIEMLADFHVFGTNSRFAQKLKNTPLWELKTRSRGGLKGGARVYFFVVDDELIVVNVEYKTGNDPSPQKILEAMIVLKAYLNRVLVVERNENV